MYFFTVVSPRAQYRMTLTEKQPDGTVAMHYGDIDESDVPNTPEFVTLPTTVSSLMLGPLPLTVS